MDASPAPSRYGTHRRAEVTQEEFGLRLMLCIVYAGSGAYTDDGEMQDNDRLPFIDFRRDTAAEIQRKIIQRNLTVEPRPPALTKRLLALADELDAELDSGAKWTKAQHTCESVSGALRELARDVSLGAPTGEKP
jgi:hypothetical protein